MQRTVTHKGFRLRKSPPYGFRPPPPPPGVGTVSAVPRRNSGRLLTRFAARRLFLSSARPTPSGMKHVEARDVGAGGPKQFQLTVWCCRPCPPQASLAPFTAEFIQGEGMQDYIHNLERATQTLEKSLPLPPLGEYVTYLQNALVSEAACFGLPLGRSRCRRDLFLLPTCGRQCRAADCRDGTHESAIDGTGRGGLGSSPWSQGAEGGKKRRR